MAAHAPGDGWSVSRERGAGRLFAALAAGAVPAVVVAARVSTGISASPDSLTYLHAADHLLERGALLGLDAEPLTIFPPLYPAMLGLLEPLTGSVGRAAALLGVVFVWLCATLTCLLLRRLRVSQAAAALLAAGAFLHPALQRVFWYAWSEGLYTFIALSLLYVAARAPRHGPATAALAAGSLAGLGFLARYAGVTLMPVAVVGLLCATNWSIRRRASAAALALLVAITIVGAWVARNLAADGTWLGPRGSSPDTTLSALTHLASAAGEVFAPVGLLAPYYPAIGLAGMAAAAAALAAVFRPSRELTLAAAPALTLAAGHAALLVYSQRTALIDPINARLLSPALVPALLVAVATVTFGRAADVPRPARRFALGCIAAAVVLYGSLSVRWIGREPSGFRLDAIDAADVPAPCALGQRPTFTNAALYLRFAGVAPEPKALPRQVAYRQREAQNDWDQFLAQLRSGSACVVWVNTDTTAAPSADTLLGGPAEGVSIDLLTHVDGVYVYEVSLAR